MIKKISGKNINIPLKHLSNYNGKITDPKEIANTFAQHFAQNSSATNHSKRFQNIKRNDGKKKRTTSTPKTQNTTSLFH